MMTDSKPTNLGRGLSALLGEPENAASSEETERNPKSLPVEFLHPGKYQPRRHMDEERIRELAQSIGEQGVLQPLLVRRHPDEPNDFEIIAGERRWRAAQLARLHEVPVIIKDLSDPEALEIALVENLQRQDLSPLEEAEGYQRLMDEFGHTQEVLAAGVGKSRSHVANMMRLLNLPGPVKAMLDSGELSSGHARALLNAPDPSEVARRVVNDNLNVRQTERLVRKVVKQGGLKKPIPAIDPDTKNLERDLTDKLGLSVNIRPKQGSGGAIIIKYTDLEQLDGIVERLTRKARPSSTDVPTEKKSTASKSNKPKKDAALEKKKPSSKSSEKNPKPPKEHTSSSSKLSSSSTSTSGSSRSSASTTSSKPKPKDPEPDPDPGNGKTKDVQQSGVSEKSKENVKSVNQQKPSSKKPEQKTSKPKREKKSNPKSSPPKTDRPKTKPTPDRTHVSTSSQLTELKIQTDSDAKPSLENRGPEKGKPKPDKKPKNPSKESGSSKLKSIRKPRTEPSSESIEPPKPSSKPKNDRKLSKKDPKPIEPISTAGTKPKSKDDQTQKLIAKPKPKISPKPTAIPSANNSNDARPNPTPGNIEDIFSIVEKIYGPGSQGQPLPDPDQSDPATAATSKDGETAKTNSRPIGKLDIKDSTGPLHNRTQRKPREQKDSQTKTNKPKPPTVRPSKREPSPPQAKQTEHVAPTKQDPSPLAPTTTGKNGPPIPLPPNRATPSQQAERAKQKARMAKGLPPKLTVNLKPASDPN